MGSAATGLKVLQPQRGTFERLKLVNHVDEYAELYVRVRNLYLYIYIYHGNSNIQQLLLIFVHVCICINFHAVGVQGPNSHCLDYDEVWAPSGDFIPC